MDHVLLRSSWDVDRALWLVEQGHSVEVTVDYETGPTGQEPKVEYLRMVLDRVQRHYQVGNREYVQHPMVDARFLRSCIVRPRPSGGTAGVREPRKPRPDPALDTFAAEPPTKKSPPMEPKRSCPED